MSIKNPVRALNAEVARKIAAGEVIDRPNAIVRELIDNAIDSKATEITVEIYGGGIDKIRVVDNGEGMTEDDLKNCARPHATSKIQTEVDLMNLSTMGFRGEALASIAAVSRLSITSGGYKMRSSITEDHIIEPVAGIKGTIVQAEGLFENFPARRQFLKRSATEALMCKNTFIEKSLAFPEISFRFINDGEIKLDLPAGQSLKDRFIDANGYRQERDLFYELSNKAEGQNPDWAFTVIIGEPAVNRTNKKEIFIYTNKRRITEYSLVQAIEYGGQGYFPNGTYPVAALFAEVAPNLIDFNIHPAKKEARFYDISALHHGVSSTIKNFFLKYTRSNFEEDKPADEVRNEDYQRHISYKINESTYSGFSDYRAKYFGGGSGAGSNGNAFGGAGAFKGDKDTSGGNEHTYSGSFSTNSSLLSASSLADIALSTPPAPQEIKFVGKCLGTFLLAEKNNSLYVVDQHAAHERILFDKIMSNQGGFQPLLIPYKIQTESKTQDNQLEKLKDRLSEIGFKTEKIKDGQWEISSVPERWTGTEYDLRSLLFVKQVEPEEIIRSIAAMTACKAAIKDGYYLDDSTAEELIKKAFTLEDPHCPHGRPIYTVFSREKLFELVKRT